MYVCMSRIPTQTVQATLSKFGMAINQLPGQTKFIFSNHPDQGGGHSVEVKRSSKTSNLIVFNFQIARFGRRVSEKLFAIFFEVIGSRGQRQLGSKVHKFWYSKSFYALLTHFLAINIMTHECDFKVTVHVCHNTCYIYIGLAAVADILLF